MKGDLSVGQRRFLQELARTELCGQLYLTGGTALAAFHLHHRDSEDLDLFSRTALDTRAITRWIASVSETEPMPHRVQQRLGFLVTVAGAPLKVEFVHYEFDHLEPPQPQVGLLRVDGLRDISANKLSAVIDRVEPKDYADLFFLLRRPGVTVDAAMEDCRAKFGWPGIRYALQAAFARVDQLPAWPALDPPVSLEDAKLAFRDFARGLIRLDEA